MVRRQNETHRRASLRRGARLNRLRKVVTSLTCLVDAISASGVGFGVFLNDFVHGRVRRISNSCGDLLPIPPVDEQLVGSCLSSDTEHIEGLTILTNLSLAGLNYLYGGFRAIAIPVRATAPQRASQQRLVIKWWGLLRRSADTADFLAGCAAPVTFDNNGSVSDGGVVLDASKVDGLHECGLVDPTSCIPPDMNELFNDPTKMFPEGLDDVPRMVAYKGGNRTEYITLVLEQLRSRKVALMRRPCAAANTFVVSKRGTDRLREVWDGNKISESCVQPSKPRWLADPASLVALEASCDRPIYLSTRDGKCFYDQLTVTDALTPFLGRPQVEISELLGAGLTSDEVRSFLIDDDESQLVPGSSVTPVCLTWPMGFAYSAFVAQQVMTASCIAAGFTETQFLTNAGALPDPGSESIAVATDDVNLFTRLSWDERAAIVRPPLHRLDEVWKAWQLAPKPEKCVDLAKSGGLLGVELINGLSLAPKFKRLGSIVSSLVSLLGSKRGSPQNVHSFLGKVQWTCLLNRPLLSSLSRVYEFVERMPFARPQHVPREVLDEFSVCFALMSYLNVDLARPWSASLVATDGAQSFGFGMAQAPCRPE